MSGYTFQMRSSKYILWQDDNGWRGYLEGYPEYEVQGESFEELQVKLWQLHQELTGQHQEPELVKDLEHYQPSDPKEHARFHSQTPTLPRPMSRAQSKRRARVEELMFAMISNRGRPLTSTLHDPVIVSPAERDTSLCHLERGHGDALRKTR